MTNKSITVLMASHITTLIGAVIYMTFLATSSCQSQEVKTDTLKYLPTDNSYIDHGTYQVDYDSDHHQPNWIAYELNYQELTINIERGSRGFKDDPLNPHDISSKLYIKSGYDRGHLVPARDMQYDSLALVKSFYMSNVSPQLPGFNRGIWKRLENQVRRWAETDEQIYIIAGTLYKDASEVLNEEVSIPTYYYKVIIDYEPEVKVIAFLFPHEKSNNHIKDYIISIDSLESLTELDFFYKLDDEIENKIESDTTLNNWNFN